MSRIRALLETKYEQFNTPSFIKTDPIQIPHSFTKKEDIEIAAFLVSTIAWGQRGTIIRNGFRLMELFEQAPHDFVCNSSQKEWDRLNSFVHRTFLPIDLHFFLDALRRLYKEHGGLESVFSAGFIQGSAFEAITHFRQVFMQWEPLARTEKHVANPAKGSAAKRINLFLMWMVRHDNRGVHFGLWPNIEQSNLMIPLDVHVARVARHLGLLKRRSNNWRAVEELTHALRQIDPHDPVRFDFSLFGLGLEKSF